jgi:hypothetical protein
MQAYLQRARTFSYRRLRQRVLIGASGRSRCRRKRRACTFTCNASKTRADYAHHILTYRKRAQTIQLYSRVCVVRSTLRRHRSLPQHSNNHTSKFVFCYNLFTFIL